jgi:hypothetical protein
MDRLHSLTIQQHPRKASANEILSPHALNEHSDDRPSGHHLELGTNPTRIVASPPRKTISHQPPRLRCVLSSWIAARRFSVSLSSTHAMTRAVYTDIL